MILTKRINGSKKTTISDVAQAVGVSKNSVSLALRGMGGVGSDTRRRIIDTALAMGYLDNKPMPDTMDDACVVVVLPNYLHEDVFFYTEVLWAIDSEAKARGICAIRIGVTKEMEETGELPVMPKGLHVMGMLVVGIFSPIYAEKLRELKLPMLSVDIMYSNLPLVGSSNLMGGLAAVRKLISHGHRDIGFIGPIRTAVSVYERWCGFIMGMIEAGLPYESKYNILGERAFQFFDTEDALEPYVSQMDGLPTAWFCAGDRISIAMIHLLTRRGLNVPGDISIIGFDDILAAQMVLPRLTTIRTDRQMMGKLAVSYFFELQQNKDIAMVSKIVPFELIERDSVAAVKI